jgi:hypothetical protein
MVKGRLLFVLLGKNVEKLGKKRMEGAGFYLSNSYRNMKLLGNLIRTLQFKALQPFYLLLLKGIL